VRITSSFDTVQRPTAIALGNFEGVHCGHVKVIPPIFKAAEHGQIMPTVVTFWPHPRAFFTGQSRSLLTPLDEKVEVLRAMGVEQLMLLPFDHALANLTPQAFVETILVQGLEARFISVGQDFHFGCGRVGTSADLEAIASGYGATVRVVPLHCSDDERISSSSIRQALELGKVARANALLGRAYTLVGEVVQGQQLGRTIGFPTANLKVPDDKFLPQRGVYAVQIRCPEWPDAQPGVMNLGVRPTVDGLRQTIEVHLLNWSGNLYGKTLTVALETFLRPEQKFDSLDALKAQIQTDCAIARSLLTTPELSEFPD